MLRVEGRDRKIWNIAADYSVNGTLTRDRIGEAPPKIKIFHDTNHYGKSSEQIYDEIYEQYDDEELHAMINCPDSIPTKALWLAQPIATHACLVLREACNRSLRTGAAIHFC